MKIFLIGLPGSGKSTLGKKLSLELGYKFFDTDDEIIRLEKRTIEEIFANEGEVYFRKKENEILNHLLAEANAVISTGGGTPCFFDNIQVINNNGISIFLNIELDAVAGRLKKGKNNNRPMVAGKTDSELLEFLQNKHAERLPFYSKASIEIEDEKMSVGALVNLLKIKSLI